MDGHGTEDDDMDGRRTRTGLLATAPIVLAAGFLVRPYVSDFTDDEAMVAAVTGEPERWLVAAVVMVAGATLLALALPAAVERVGGGRRGRWTRPAAVIAAVGFALHTGLVGLGGAAAVRVGADLPDFLDAVGSWEVTVLSVSLLALAVAWAGVARAVAGSDLPRGTTWVVLTGAALGALGHLYPASAGEYVAAAGTAAALWPLAAIRGA